VYVNGNAAVSGTLAGQLTILTQGDLMASPAARAVILASLIGPCA